MRRTLNSTLTPDRTRPLLPVVLAIVIKAVCWRRCVPGLGVTGMDGGLAAAAGALPRRLLCAIRVNAGRHSKSALID